MIKKCLAANLALTVQTVVSSRNENDREWIELRELLLQLGVKHWVMHAAVRGGKARRAEEAARLQRRPRTLLPSSEVYSRLWRFVSSTIDRGLPIDIRCTDTDNSPNSVLLIASNGDLYTEGYAHKGKVKLFDAMGGRPDLVQRLMGRHLDRFGHTRRYLNWNPWFFDGKSIEDTCVQLPGISEAEEDGSKLVETEAKFPVTSPLGIVRALSSLGFRGGRQQVQRDEYFDTPTGLVRQTDTVVRVRIENGRTLLALKGARYWTADGANSRIELELSGLDVRRLRRELAGRGLLRTWFLEKRRREFRSKDWPQLLVALDEIPELGVFAEIEGPLASVRELRERLAGHLGGVETRNYRELVVDHKRARGLNDAEIGGAEF